MNYEVVVITCLTLSSMIGAGVLVVPKEVLPFGFAATIGWIVASICSFVLAKMFVEITLSQKTDSSAGLPGIVRSEYGNQSAFVVGFGQWLFVCFGCSAVTLVYVGYLADLLAFSNPFHEFLISISTIFSFTILYYFSTAALGILSVLALLKIMLFTITSILGVIDFNFNHVFGISDSAGSVISSGGGFLSNALSVLKYAFTHCNGEPVSFSKFMSYVFKSSSIALFAFAGMESAASSSSSVKDPKNTIPKATMIAVITCSVIFILTHICVVNALPVSANSEIPRAPVRKAVEILIGQRFGDYASFVCGNLVSIFAVIGCFGSVMTFCFIAPNCLYDTLSIAYPDLSKKIPRSKTNFSLPCGIASSAVIASVIFFYYFVNRSISVFLDYDISLLIFAYLQCAFVHLKRRVNLPLSFCSILVCFFFMSGCSLAAIVFGLIVSYISNILFILISPKNSRSEEEDNILNTRDEPMIKVDNEEMSINPCFYPDQEDL